MGLRMKVKRPLQKKENWKYPPGGPINNDNSECRKLWTGKTGPGQKGAKLAADFYKDKPLLMKTRIVSSGVKDVGHSVGVKFGCTQPIPGWNIRTSGLKKRVGSSYYIICGCFEIWCPVKNLRIANPRDSRKRCFTLRKIFGCYKRNGAQRRYAWHPDCKHASKRGKGFVEVTLF